MPYILPEDRTERLLVGALEGADGDETGVAMTREEIGQVVGEAMRNGGDLQYILAVAFQQYLENVGLRYQNCQDILGALEGAKAEFYRCVLAPYEDAKIAENGAVYDLDKLNNTGY